MVKITPDQVVKVVQELAAMSMPTKRQRKETRGGTPKGPNFPPRLNLRGINRVVWPSMFCTPDE